MLAGFLLSDTGTLNLHVCLTVISAYYIFQHDDNITMQRSHNHPVLDVWQLHLTYLSYKNFIAELPKAGILGILDTADHFPKPSRLRNILNNSRIVSCCAVIYLTMFHFEIIISSTVIHQPFQF